MGRGVAAPVSILCFVPLLCVRDVHSILSAALCAPSISEHEFSARSLGAPQSQAIS